MGTQNSKTQKTKKSGPPLPHYCYHPLAFLLKTFLQYFSYSKLKNSKTQKTKKVGAATATLLLPPARLPTQNFPSILFLLKTQKLKNSKNKKSRGRHCHTTATTRSPSYSKLKISKTQKTKKVGAAT